MCTLSPYIQELFNYNYKSPNFILNKYLDHNKNSNFKVKRKKSYSKNAEINLITIISIFKVRLRQEQAEKALGFFLKFFSLMLNCK